MGAFTEHTIGPEREYITSLGGKGIEIECRSENAPPTHSMTAGRVQ